MPTISYIVPTLRRPQHLRRCLTAIAAQTVPATEVLVGVRADDLDSPVVVGEFTNLLPVRVVTAGGVGVVGSMQSCLDISKGEFVALVDDDVELPPHWLKTMLGHLEEQPAAVAASGRDLLQDHPEMRRMELLTEDVGRIHWYGRVTGNHHRGGGKARRVDILRGSNNLFCGDFLRSVGFDQRLRGKGAQVHWEMALGLRAGTQGRWMIYDPAIGVIHHVAPRFDNDGVHRGNLDPEPIRDIAFNETWVTLRHGRGLTPPTMLMWQYVVGAGATPGIGRLLLPIAMMNPEKWRLFRSTHRGRWDAIRAVWDLRCRQHVES